MLALLTAQLQDNAVGVVVLAALVAWASIAPFKFNPQEYDANPASLTGKTANLSGFLCVVRESLPRGGGWGDDSKNTSQNKPPRTSLFCFPRNVHFLLASVQPCSPSFELTLVSYS